jgi:hypothetical protein
LIFEEAEQLALYGERHVADFVEKQRAAVRRFELAPRQFGGTGEGTLLVSEELAFEQRLGHRRTVDGHERARAAG